MTMSSTHDLFIDFASFGAGRQTLQQMDGRSFAKLCRDCRLIDRSLTLIDVDILFTKVKERGKRKITYPQFRLALQMIAEKKGVSLRHLEQELSQCAGPINMTSATVDQDYILQKMTDTRLYTGAHKERFDEDGRGRGLEGRGVIPGSVGLVSDPLGMLCTRQNITSVDVRGRPQWSARRRESSWGGGALGPGPMTARELAEVTSMYNAALPGASVAGSKAGSKAGSRAGSRGGSRSVSPAGSPRSTYRRSSRGPSPQARTRPMSAQMHRQEYVPSSPNAGAAPRRRPQSAQRSRADGRRYSVNLQKKGGSGLTLDALYVAFASFGMGGELCSDMDGAHFAKLCRDCNLIDHDFTLVDVDLIFSKCKTRGERKISFAEFHDALTMISEHKQVSKHDLVNFLLQAEGPVVYAAQAEKASRGSVLERLTDTKRYTGAHKHRFDENGRGRGLQGRTSDGVSSVRDPLGQLCERKGTAGIFASKVAA